ncbi:conserved hypothetical protein [Methylocella tundrae]|uniref:Uncharacterized protein n=1 Tax=Methylocella tundrae TaxID=227605 RepID=A0A8B6M3L9_METTU|nr:conserved hypothetical protein [Methylocella tundrae]VTZ48870.1 conserved hypothetical protein [Methylocella tundrae]
MRGSTTGKGLLLAVEATKPGTRHSTLPPRKPILPVVLPQHAPSAGGPVHGAHYKPPARPAQWLSKNEK